MNDLAVAWRDEQIEMLKEEVSRLNRLLSEATARAKHEYERAETAENRARILRAEVEEYVGSGS